MADSSDPNIRIAFTTTADTTGATQTANTIQAVTGAASGAAVGTKTMTSALAAAGEEHATFHEKQKRTIEGLHMIGMMSGGEFKEGLHEGVLAMKLLGSFTGELSMGIVGAALLIGQAIPQIVGYFKEMGSEAAEEAKKLKEEAKKATEEAEKLAGTKFDDLGKELKQERENVDAVKESFTESRTAANELAKSQLSNASNEHTAWVQLDVVLGTYRDKIKEIRAMADADAKKRELNAKIELDSSKEKQQKAAENVASRQKELDDELSIRIIESGKLFDAKERLKVLKEEREELEKIVKEDQRLNDLEAITGNYATDSSTRRAKAEDAKLTLKAAETGVTKGDEADLTGQVAGLKKGLDDQEKKIQTLSNSLSKAYLQNEDVEKAAVDVEKKINETKKADDTVAVLKTVEEEFKEGASEAKKITDGLVLANTGSALANKNLAAANDDLTRIGKTLTETVADIPKAGRDIDVLIGQVQAGMVSSSNFTKETLLKMMQEFKSNQDRMNQDLKALQSQRQQNR